MVERYKSSVSPKQNFLLYARFGRRALRRFRQSLRYGRRALSQSPILFANSFPKSGTHLLTQVMQGFTHIGPAVVSGLPAVVTFDGLTGRQRSESEILSDLGILLPGDVAYGHVHAFPGALAYLCQPGFAAFFILRDPRDVAVSHVHYVAEMAPNHIHHRYYQEALHTFDERLQASIAGVSQAAFQQKYGADTQALLPHIRERFEPYLGWLEQPGVLALRYEIFSSDRQAALASVFDHAVRRGFVCRLDLQAALEALSKSIDPQRSPTFRSGKTGGWRAVFTPAHKALFKEICGDLLIRLGYETNQDW
ncbi:MAG: hypothetical protein AB1894_16660 [Chloroflexota bacterium]